VNKSSKRKRCILIVGDMKDGEQSSNYVVECFNDIDGVLVLKNIVEKHKMKFLKILMKEKPEIIIILTEIKNIKKIHIKISKELKKFLPTNKHIAKSNKIKSNPFIIDIIDNLNIPYCHVELPKDMDFAEKFNIQSSIIKKLMINLFSEIYI
jgi:hypothetical protein